MREFMLSPMYVRLLAGPIGGGKSVCCVHELIRQAQLQRPNVDNVRKTRFLVVRNTADQLRQTTCKTFFDWVPPGIAGVWRSSEKTFYLKAALADSTKIEAEFLFIALDTPDDVRKALSLEATGLWGNECRELHPEVVDGLLGRINRFPSMRDGCPTNPCAIFDTNMPGMDTWWWEMMTNPPDNWSIHVQPPAVIPKEDYIALCTDASPPLPCDTSQIVGKYAINPKADNLANLADTYYINQIPGKKEDWIDTYLRCMFSKSLEGLPVYLHSFKEDFHVTKNDLTPIKSEAHPLLIGLDFGRTPAAVIGQLDHLGRVLVFNEVSVKFDESMGLERFLDTRLVPFLRNTYPLYKHVFIYDPAGNQRSQINEKSCADILKEFGLQALPGLTNDPNLRINAVEALLSTQVDGKAGVIISHKCKTLVQGFKYGYRYKLKRRGEYEDKPDKNSFSHIHDAFQYLCTYIRSPMRQRTAQRAILPGPARVVPVAAWT